MKHQVYTLENGLKVLVVPMPNLASATVAVWVKTGSRYEEKKVNGISHFLEHMVFKGSPKRPSAKEISEAVDAIGGEFNAATSKDWTNFYIKSAVENLDTAFDVLSDMVLHPLLKSEEIEREKGTIIQEIAMYEDTPMMHIGDVFEQLAFSGNALGWDTAGSAASVRGIKKENFVRYRNTHYYPENMLVSVVGGITTEQALTLVKKYFRDFPSSPEKSTSFTEFKVKQAAPQVKLKTKKSDQAHLILGFAADGRGYPGRYAQAILATILGGGMSSRLFIEVRERRGLAYSVRTNPERYQEVGYMGTYAGVNPKKVDEAISVMLEQHYQLASGKLPISAKELSKAKEYLKGHLALALEATSDVTAFYADQVLFLKQVQSPEAVFSKVDDVTVAEVIAEAKRLFVPSRLNLAIIGNYNNQTRFEKLTK